MPGTFTGVIRVTASKDGYLSATKPFSQGVGHVFSLDPIEPSANIAGMFTLTLTAASVCTGLPNEARQRVYTATIVPLRPSYFRATLSDARFFSACLPGQRPETCGHDKFGIGMVGDYAGIYLQISEQVAETTYLMVEGRVEGSFDPSGFAARLNGSVVYCHGAPVLIDQGTWVCLASAAVQCDSHDHQFKLLRR